eukprot:TRINITY_DN3995_c0_g1_i5.p1 TRINITY_DN3995_c0_g1~~TRINITY_DN3995_c0_g1_i5.p1  ORF type:complete len:384 (+),score=60.16 TRINITY_DN3995_c0_g1_i5:1349-2500(+)
MSQRPRHKRSGNFDYDSQEAGFFVVSMRYTNTVLPAVSKIPGFWIFFLVHLFLWSNHRYEFIPNFAEMVKEGGPLFIDLGHLKIIGGITVFFEVFYTNQCYSRYFRMANTVNDIFQTAHKITLEQSTLLNKAGPQYSRLVARWIRAVLLLFFTELKHGPLQQSTWDEAVLHGLLRRDEVTALIGLGMPARNNRIAHWMMRVTLSAYEADGKGPPVLMALMNRLIVLRDDMNMLLQTHRTPVPFVYYHLLNSMICINCALWAFCMSAIQSVFGPFIFLLASLLYIGMLEVAKAMSDPFGDDDVDFPLEVWYDKFIEGQREALSDYETPPTLFDEALKQELASPQKNMFLGSIIGSGSDGASGKQDAEYEELLSQTPSERVVTVA